MALVAELDTPAVVIDLDIVEANIRRAQDHLARFGIANRPHTKTHKIPALAKRQMAAGARMSTSVSSSNAIPDSGATAFKVRRPLTTSRAWP
jgi:D-serine deaminase-like pyridoxal phosphate-dependent protein